jgi:hypothetical protein
MDEGLAVTLRVVQVLEDLAVPYLIGGSLASAYHGVARTTVVGVQGAMLDWAYMHMLAQTLGVEDLLQRLHQAAG